MNENESETEQYIQSLSTFQAFLLLQICFQEINKLLYSVSHGPMIVSTDKLNRLYVSFHNAAELAIKRTDCCHLKVDFQELPENILTDLDSFDVAWEPIFQPPLMRLKADVEKYLTLNYQLDQKLHENFYELVKLNDDALVEQKKIVEESFNKILSGINKPVTDTTNIPVAIPRKQGIFEGGPIKWEDISIEFIDGENVRIVAPGNFIKETSCGEMGFHNLRKIPRVPNKQWLLLTILAASRGSFSWEDDVADETLKKTKQILSDGLKEYFGIVDDPFRTYKKEGAYEIKLHLTPWQRCDVSELIRRIKSKKRAGRAKNPPSQSPLDDESDEDDDVLGIAEELEQFNRK